MDKIQEYLKGLEIGGKSIHTIRGYKSSLDKFQEYFKVSTFDDLNNLTTSQIQNFYEDVSKSWKPNTLNALIRNLTAFFKWLKRKKFITGEHPFFMVDFGGKRFVKVPKVKKMILTEEETRNLIKAGATIQDKFMISLMSFTAIRRDEVCKIKISDIEGCKIQINGKGEKQRNVYLDETMCHLLNIYMSQRNTDSEYLFYPTRGESSESGSLTGTTIANRIKSAGERSGIPAEKLAKLTPHRLRGGGLTRLIKLYGVDTARMIAGHSSNKITEIYNEGQDDIVRYALQNQMSLINQQKLETMSGVPSVH
jgi:integrase/recombinase XerD